MMRNVEMQCRERRHRIEPGPALRVAAQPELQMAAHIRPFAGENAINDAVADASIAADGVMAQNTILFCSQGLDGPLGAEVKIIGP